MQNFKHMLAWQRAHALTISLHEHTRHFSRRGHATLRTQLTRAAASMPTNMVEGCGAATGKEFARFLDIAIKSTSETEYHLLLARDFGLITTEVWQRYTHEVTEIRKMTYAYRKRVLEKARVRERRAE